MIDKSKLDSVEEFKLNLFGRKFREILDFEEAFIELESFGLSEDIIDSIFRRFGKITQKLKLSLG